MKNIIIVLLMALSNFGFSQNYKEFRALMKTGETSEQSAKILIEKANKEFSENKKPIYKGFMAVGNFFMAKHAFNPLKKMSYFNQGKKLMEEAIKNDNKNLELRLMRLISQEKAPRFLGYHSSVSEDRLFLTKEYKNTTDEDLVAYIKKYLKIN